MHDLEYPAQYRSTLHLITLAAALFQVNFTRYHYISQHTTGEGVGSGGRGCWLTRPPHTRVVS